MHAHRFKPVKGRVLEEPVVELVDEVVVPATLLGAEEDRVGDAEVVEVVVDDVLPCELEPCG
jgi:hypothetical protein